MDGIEITRVYHDDNVNKITDFSYVPDDEIGKLIALNEPNQPEFKHSVKLTPNLAHPSLKKRVKRRSVNDLDDETFTDDSINSRKSFCLEDLSSKIKKARDVLTSLKGEIAELKKAKQDCLKEKKILDRDLKSTNRSLQKKILLLHKYDDNLKKRGRRVGGKKLRDELGIPLPTKTETKSRESLKTSIPCVARCGPKMKRQTKSECVKETKGGSPTNFENIPIDIQKTVKRRLSSLCSDSDSMLEPLKEKNFNTDVVLKVSPKKIDKNDFTLARDVAIEDKGDTVEPEADNHASTQDLRCEETFDDLKMSEEPSVAGPSEETSVGTVRRAPSSRGSTRNSLKRASAEQVVHVTEAKKIKKTKVVSRTSSIRSRSVESDASSVSCRSLKVAKASMMKGVTSKKICVKCLIGDETVKQCSKCFTHYHLSCVNSSSSEADDTHWVCSDCVLSKNACFVCKSRKGTRQMCLTKNCGKYYHQDCLKLFPQTKFNYENRLNKGLIVDPDDTSPLPLEITTCPRHTCHTCSSDNTFVADFVNLDKMLTCIKCPTSYHCAPGVCLAAGSEILSTREIICGGHYEKTSKGVTSGLKPVNVSWCFMCSKHRNSKLIKCWLCPAAIHIDCLKIELPVGNYICEECDSGRFPLQGEIAWVKLAAYRWWPARILYPDEIPVNLLKLKVKPCEFPVMFYGTKNYQWSNRGRTFLFHDGDAESDIRIYGKLDASFTMAMREALQAFVELRKFKADIRIQGNPDRYTKIRGCRDSTNSTRRNGNFEPHVCDCSASDPDPCGPSSNCINRELYIECRPNLCPAGTRCLNQRLAKREYAPLKYFKTRQCGWGIVSTKDLVQGQLVIEYVGEIIDDCELKRRLKINQEAKKTNYYLMSLDANRIIDAEKMGNMARFINHSCEPNCESQKWTVNQSTRIGIFATKDIPSGVELSFNYDWKIRGLKTVCSCEAPSCSGFIQQPLKGKGKVTDPNLKLHPAKKKRKKNKKPKVNGEEK